MEKWRGEDEVTHFESVDLLTFSKVFAILSRKPSYDRVRHGSLISVKSSPKNQP